MAIRYNTIADRPYDDKTGRWVSWGRAGKSSRFRTEIEEYEEFLSILRRPPIPVKKPPVPPRRPPVEPELEPEPEYVEEYKVERYDVLQDIVDIYLEEYDVLVEDINEQLY